MKMGFFGESWGALAIALVFLITLWLMNGGREWCRKQFRFIVCAAEMPGPPAFPLIGNLLYFVLGNGDLINRIVKLAKPFNTPFRFWLGPKLCVGMRDPRDIEIVIKSPVVTEKPEEYSLIASYMGVGGAMNSLGDKFQPKLLLPMSLENSLNKYFEIFDRQTRRCVECLAKRVDDGEFEVTNYVGNCCLDVILETIMGTTGTAQQGGYKDFVDCSSRASRLSYERSMKFWLRYDWIYNLTKDGQQFAKDMKKLHEFTDSLVSREEKTHHDSVDHNNFQDQDRTPVLDGLSTFNEENQKLIDTGMRDEITSIWSMVLEPITVTISFLLVMLGMHHEVQEKVLKEVREVVGDSDITVDHLSKLNYLEMVFKETVRLFPMAPVVLREMQEDLDFETCTAPKDCTVALFVYMVHRDPRYWKEPETFNPERFEPGNSAGRHPYAYLPFGNSFTGRVGQNYAIMLTKMLVAKLVRKYRIGHSGSLETFRLKTTDCIRSIDGYKVSITKV